MAPTLITGMVEFKQETLWKQSFGFIKLMGKDMNCGRTVVKLGLNDTMKIIMRMRMEMKKNSPEEKEKDWWEKPFEIRVWKNNPEIEWWTAETKFAKAKSFFDDSIEFYTVVANHSTKEEVLEEIKKMIDELREDRKTKKLKLEIKDNAEKVYY
jgi:hypothetical protein